nr:MAG TPA: hypothetical protein [Caudoviricetes sp.]
MYFLSFSIFLYSYYMIHIILHIKNSNNIINFAITNYF